MGLRQVRDGAIALVARSLPALALLACSASAPSSLPGGDARPPGSATGTGAPSATSAGLAWDAPGAEPADPAPPPGCAPLPDRSLVLAPQLGTGDAAFQADYSPDGRLFVTSGSDGTLRVFDGATAQLRLELAGSRGHEGPARFGPSSAWVAAAQGTRVLAWNLETGAQKTLLDAGERVFEIALSPDGAALVTNHDRHLRTWALEADGARELSTLPTGIERAVFSPDSRTVLTFERSVFVPKTVTLWDASSGQRLWSSTGTTGDAGGIAVWRPDGSEVAWIPKGDAVDVLDPKTGAVKRTLRAPFELESLGWGKGDEHVRVVVWGRHGEIAVLDAASGRVVASHKNVRFHAFVVSPDGRFVGIRRVNEGATLLDVGQPSALVDLPVPGDDLWQMAFHPREKRLAVTPGTRARIPSVIDLRDQRATRGELPVMDVVELALRADGSELFTLQADARGWDRGIRRFDAKTGAARGLIEPPAPKKDEYVNLSHVLASPSGEHLLAMRMGRVDLFDGQGRHVRVAEAFPRFKTEMPGAFSRDGRRMALAGGDKNTVRVYDPNAGLVKESEGGVGRIVSLAFNPTRKRLAVAATGKVAILDPETGRSSGLLEGDFRRVESMVWRDADTLFLGNETGSLGRVVVGGKVELFAAHDARVRSIALSADGKWLASSAEDGTVKIWDAAAMKLERAFDVGNRAGTSVVWHPTAPVVFAARGSVFALRVDGAMAVLDLVRSDPDVLGVAHSNAGLFSGDAKAFAAVRFLPSGARATGDFVWYDAAPQRRRPALFEELARGCPVSR
jgi:WD40 repeat protein